MELVAVYIKEHHYLFGKASQTLNLGGRYFYKFEDNGETILIDRDENKKHISDFFSESISSISAIVGANGTGKTTLLKVLNRGYLEDTQAVFLYENCNEGTMEYLVHNRIGLLDVNGAINEKTKPKISFREEGIITADIKIDSIQSLYYTSIYDKNIKSIGSILNLESNHIEETLEEIYFRVLSKEILFLSSEIKNKIVKQYEDFPSYNNIIIRPKKLYKRDFKNVYREANIGNPNKSDELKYTIERDLQDKDKLKHVRIEDFLKEYHNILTIENISDALDSIWNLSQYKNENINIQQLIHDSSSFLKSLEISILSFLVLKDIYANTNLAGSINFDEILEESNFDIKLDLFLKKYIIQTDKSFVEKVGEISIDDNEKLIEECEKYYKRWHQLEGVNAVSLQEKIIYDIKGFKAIKDFYTLFSINKDLIIDSDNISSFQLNVDDSRTITILEEIGKVYFKVKTYVSSIPFNINDIIEFDVDKKLSHGEKSLLNLYATLYEFTINKDHHREKENYLLTLDEADIGFHPKWKKKYIKALISTMPIIFENLVPKKYDLTLKRKVVTEKIYPIVQVIFTTHDPLTLSDLPNSNIVYLDKNNGHTRVLDYDDERRPSRTFGANITNLLSESFFIDKGLIGDFSKEKIQSTINWINKMKESKTKDSDLFKIELEHHKKIVLIIDEPIVRMKLSEMLSEVEGDRYLQKQAIENEIAFLKNKLNKLN